MPLLDILLLGILEGLTEFLPVSSTGHLILLGSYLGHEGEADKVIEVVIQLGAVLAVVVYYRAKLLALALGTWKRDPASLRLLAALGAAFVPAAVVGLLLHGFIKRVLFGPIPVAIALVAGGVLMVAIELARSRRPPPITALKDVTLARGFAIGLSQCLSLWPGTSRSMTTIVGGQLSGLSTETAAEFSFLLAIPTLGAATMYDLLKNREVLAHAPGGLSVVLVGLVVSFVVALAVIAAFLRYLKRFGLLPFGLYRIALGIVVLALASRVTTG